MKGTKEKAWERFAKNLATTILGLAGLAFCGIMIYTEKSDATTMSGWFAVSLGLLRSKNSLIGFPNPK